MIETINNILDYRLFRSGSFRLTVLNLIILVFVIFLTGIILRLIRAVVTRNLPEEDKNRFISFFQFIRYIVFIFAIVFTLDACGINMKIFLTASAALLVGLGFALQQLFQDIISGILIIIDKSLHVGDIIEVDGKVGIVDKIKLRTTRVVTRNDRVMIVPNHKFMNETLFNWTQNGTTNREQVDIGVAYGSDVELVKTILIDCVKNVEGILEERDVSVHFADFADSSLNFSVFFYVRNGLHSPKIQSDIRYNIDKKFRENNIVIPFPQRDLNFIQNKIQEK